MPNYACRRCRLSALPLHFDTSVSQASLAMAEAECYSLVSRLSPIHQYDLTSESNCREIPKTQQPRKAGLLKVKRKSGLILYGETETILHGKVFRV
ncbi:hypothetical protein Mal48_28670 [Thalassoglobus polymorphus]|uniref:Uncharacterized protein n=1 Tax=Thalassoglobus polymorphus TaxID=2527994 RepID=A0A517QPV7_9PLAN|nr:hypothetical protein Mal48_28670 [Thalassoglobus polymorphus]